jgi:hypothetical protein
VKTLHQRRFSIGAAVAAAAVVSALSGAASPARAAVSAEACFAEKSRAWSKLRQCERREEAKAIVGRSSDPFRCRLKFNKTYDRIEGKASALGIACRYLNHFDGTVTDFKTGLMWARLSRLDGVPSADVLDPDNTYDWWSAHAAASSLSGASFNGEAIFVPFGFPLYPDWRLPTIFELRATVDCAFIGYCFSPELGASRANTHYWSSTNNAGDGSRAWTIIPRTVRSATSPRASAEACARCAARCEPSCPPSRTPIAS